MKNKKGEHISVLAKTMFPFYAYFNNVGVTMHAQECYKIINKLAKHPSVDQDPQIFKLLQELTDLINDMEKEIDHVKKMAVWGKDY